MKTKVLLLIAAALLCGCAEVPLPDDEPSSPASPFADESKRPQSDSTLSGDETSRAVAARLRQVRSTTEPRTQSKAMGEMPNGSSMHGHGADKVRSNIPSAKSSYFTCVMHPEIDREQPGKCPKCGMDLILKEREQSK